MEYLEGGDLDARIQKKVDPENALQWLEAIGNCLISSTERESSTETSNQEIF